MRRITSHRLLSSVLVVSAALFVGCGDDDGSTTDTTTTSTTTSATTTTAPDATQTVSVFFSTGDGTDCGAVGRYDREVPATADPVQAAFEELLGGPTASESDQGASSFFSADTGDAVESAVLEEGLLVVDFVDLRPTIPNASTSCGSAALLAQLDATAFQFPDVQRVRYQINGSCDLFFGWLQGECTDRDRSGPVLPADVPTVERASGSGCTPGAGDLPDGRWFGFIGTVGPSDLTFDLACWFTGEAAVDAAAEDGEESPPPNDYHIRNDNDLLRRIDIATDAMVTWLPNPGDPSTTATVDYPTWAEDRPLRSFQPGVWLTVDDGALVFIEEQYVP